MHIIRNKGRVVNFFATFNELLSLKWRMEKHTADDGEESVFLYTYPNDDIRIRLYLTEGYSVSLDMKHSHNNFIAVIEVCYVPDSSRVILRRIPTTDNPKTFFTDSEILDLYKRIRAAVKAM